MTNIFILSLLLLTNTPTNNFTAWDYTNNISWRISSNLCQTAVFTVAGVGKWAIEFDDDLFPSTRISNVSIGMNFTRITPFYTNTIYQTNIINVPIINIYYTSSGFFRVVTN